MISVDIVTQSFNLSIVGQTARNRSTVDNLQGGKRNIFLYIFLKRTNRLTANKLSDYYFFVKKKGKKKKKRKKKKKKDFPVVKATRWPSRSMPVEKEASVDFPQNGAFRSDSYPPSTAFYYLSIRLAYAKRREKKKQIKKKKYTPSKCLGNGNRNFLSTPQRVGKLGDRYALVDSIRIDCDA